ncbi:aldo/keto reductase family protein [Promicromonospora sp. CA-289599]|uniref:aldo/keto reductase family protein n=1 Tax=Promicromonospora sp. CA-289599 TaxID=3240014 RepID=UPI003D94C3CB
MNQDPVARVILGTMTFGHRGRGVRIDDPAQVQRLIDELAAHGHHELDTCYVYGGGTCEELLGELRAAERFGLAIRFDPVATPHGHEPDILIRSVRASLERLATTKVQILYLNLRDSGTPLKSTLGAVQELHEEGVFDELGLSNVAPGDVAECVSIAERQSWIKPSVYQGLYNAISRAVEPELLPELRRHDIRFHAYNPLAGGAFAPGFGQADRVESGSRFDDRQPQGKEYRSRYWNDAYLAGLDEVRQACRSGGIAPIEAALRWLVHHSRLDARSGDGIILGASSLGHLQQNLAAVEAGPLPGAVVTALDRAAEITRPAWPPVARTV